MSPVPEIELNLGPLEAIPPGEGRSYDVKGTPVAVFHTRAGDVFATQAFCPHKAGPLADGLVGGNTVICPLHMWKFDLATGEALLGSCGLATYPVHLNNQGQLILTLKVPAAPFLSQ